MQTEYQMLALTTRRDQTIVLGSDPWTFVFIVCELNLCKLNCNKAKWLTEYTT